MYNRVSKLCGIIYWFIICYMSTNMAGINVLYYCPIWYWYEEEELFKEIIGNYIKERQEKRRKEAFLCKAQSDIVSMCNYNSDYSSSDCVSYIRWWYGHGSIQRFFTTVDFTTQQHKLIVIQIMTILTPPNPGIDVPTITAEVHTTHLQILLHPQ